MNDAERHAHHHDLIHERYTALQTAHRRTGVQRMRCRELAKRVYTVLAGHLRGEHGWQRISGPPLSVAELHEIHVQYHEQEQDPCPPSTSTQ